MTDRLALYLVWVVTTICGYGFLKTVEKWGTSLNSKHASNRPKSPLLTGGLAVLLGWMYLGEVITRGEIAYSLGVQNETPLWAALGALPLALITFMTVGTLIAVLKGSRDWSSLWSQQLLGLFNLSLGLFYIAVRGDFAIFADTFIEGMAIAIHLLAGIDLIIHYGKFRLSLPRRRCPHCGSTWNRIFVSHGPFGGITGELFCYSCQRWSG